MSQPVVRSEPVADELVGDDGAVVLVPYDDEHRVIRVSVLGQAIRELANQGIALDVLEGALVQRLGTPDAGDTSALVAAAVEALAAEGLVSVEVDLHEASHLPSDLR